MKAALSPAVAGVHHAEILLLHPAGSEDPQRVSLAIGLLEWIRLWLESRHVRATLWPETAVDPEGHRRFIMRPSAWVAPAVRRKLALAPAAEGVVYLNVDGAPEPPVAHVSLEDRRGDRLAEVVIPLSPDGIYESVPEAIEHLMKALELTFSRQTSAELFHTADCGTAVASLYAIERTVAFGAGVGGDDPQRLLEPIVQALSRDPAHPIARECLIRMTTAMIETGRADNQAVAIAALERWCALAPLSAAPPYHLAVARLRVERAEEARAAFEDSLRRDPVYLPSLQGYADWLANRGFIDQAVALLRQAIERSAFAGNLLDQAGCVLANAGRLNEAEPFFRKAIEAGGPQTAYTNLGRSLLARAKEDDALEVLMRGLAAASDLGLLDLLAELSRRPGLAAARARAVLRGRIGEGSADPATQRALVEWSFEMDGAAAATPHARKLIEIAPPGDIRRYAYTIVLRAKVPDFAERWDSAVGTVTRNEAAKMEDAAAFFREVIEAEPEFGRAHFLLGVALERLGRMPEAAPHLERAAIHEADDAVVLDLLARARGEAGDMQGAAQVHFRAASLAAKDPRILRNAAISLIRAGFIDEGVAMANVSLAIQPGQEDLISLLAQIRESARREAKKSWIDKISRSLHGKKG